MARLCYLYVAVSWHAETASGMDLAREIDKKTFVRTRVLLGLVATNFAFQYETC